MLRELWHVVFISPKIFNQWKPKVYVLLASYNEKWNYLWVGIIIMCFFFVILTKAFIFSTMLTCSCYKTK